MYYHKMDPKFFDDVMPWERDLYLNMLTQKVEEENERIKEQESKRRVQQAKR